MQHLSGRFRSVLMAAGVFALTAGDAAAQIIPGDTPGTGIGAAVSNSRSRPLLGLSRGGASAEPEYRPKPASGSQNRKPASDPWAGMRQTAPNPSYDRHRPY